MATFLEYTQKRLLQERETLGTIAADTASIVVELMETLGLNSIPVPPTVRSRMTEIGELTAAYKLSCAGWDERNLLPDLAGLAGLTDEERKAMAGLLAICDLPDFTNTGSSDEPSEALEHAGAIL